MAPSGRHRYPAEFRRKVLDLLAAGNSVASVAHDPDLSDRMIYNWRRQDRIDGGLQPGVSTAENAESAKAKMPIAELQTKLGISRRAIKLLKDATSPKIGTRPSK
jgi:transposase